ncbi:MAG: hypothetical protein WBP26_01235 [Candidatus Saccharimonadales bacterium]
MEFLHNIRTNPVFRGSVYTLSALALAGGLYIAHEQGEAMRQGPTIEELLESDFSIRPEATALNQAVIIEEEK